MRPISEAIRTLGGSPIAVAAPPIFENITVAISTWTVIDKSKGFEILGEPLLKNY